MRVAPDGWKGVEFMILEFIGRVLKAMVWLVLFLLRCVLELAKMTLLVFGLVSSYQQLLQRYDLGHSITCSFSI